MNNFIAFANGFISYLVCFIVFILAIVIACFVGIAIRKAKNKKAEAILADGSGVTEESSDN